MKFIKKYTIFEKEMSDDWFDKNQDNYLLTNKHKPLKKKKNRNTFDVDILKEINIDEIILKKEIEEDRVRYFCIYSNKEYFLSDKFLTSIDVCNSEGSGLFNRIHVHQPLYIEYRDIGLGYKCYKAVINDAGWARSSEFATNENSRRIWKNLIKDKDYYAFEVKTNYPLETGKGFIVFSKKMNKNEISKILDEFVSDNNEIITKDPNF